MFGIIVFYIPQIIMSNYLILILEFQIHYYIPWWHAYYYSKHRNELSYFIMPLFIAYITKFALQY